MAHQIWKVFAQIPLEGVFQKVTKTLFSQTGIKKQKQ
jgi:hypothetical protein